MASHVFEKTIMNACCNTIEVKIYLGLRVGYTNKIHDIKEVKEICQNFVNEISLCVTVTPTEFIYKNGNEPGCIIGLINYPRFPNDLFTICTHAKNLGEILMKKMEQFRVTVVYPDSSILLENKDMQSEIMDTLKKVG